MALKCKYKVLSYISPLNLCVVCVCVCVCVRARACSSLGCLDDMCSQRHLECPECERWRGEARSFVATPLTAGHAPAIGRSPEVGVQSGSCHSSEERSEVNFHRSSPFLPSPSGVLPAQTRATKSELHWFFSFFFSFSQGFFKPYC